MDCRNIIFVNKRGFPFCVLCVEGYAISARSLARTAMPCRFRASKSGSFASSMVGALGRSRARVGVATAIAWFVPGAMPADGWRHRSDSQAAWSVEGAQCGRGDPITLCLHRRRNIA